MEECQLEVDCGRISITEEQGEIVLRIVGSLKSEGGRSQPVRLANPHLIDALEKQYAELFRSKVVKPLVEQPQQQPQKEKEEVKSDTFSQSSNNSKPPPAIFTSRPS